MIWSSRVDRSKVGEYPFRRSIEGGEDRAEGAKQCMHARAAKGGWLGTQRTWKAVAEAMRHAPTRAPLRATMGEVGACWGRGVRGFGQGSGRGGSSDSFSSTSASQQQQLLFSRSELSLPAREIQPTRAWTQSRLDALVGYSNGLNGKPAAPIKSKNAPSAR
jgi:hypothetical protein